jgi:hypothetical protein
MRYFFSAARGENLLICVYLVGVTRAGHTLSMDRRCLVLNDFNVNFESNPNFSY